MRKGKRIYACAHRLVWHFFNGQIPDGMCINHKNGIKTDNRPSNLEIVSYSENMRHAFKNGLKTQWGENNPFAKLSDFNAVEARIIYAKGKTTQREIAEKFGVSHQTISQIIKGQRRDWQKGPILSKDNRQKFFKPMRNKQTGQWMSGRQPIPPDLQIRETPEK